MKRKDGIMNVTVSLEERHPMTEPSSSAQFDYPPAAWSFTGEATDPSDMSALERLSSYFMQRYGRHDDGTFTVENDSFILMLAAAVDNFQLLHDAVNSLACDAFSCQHATHYEDGQKVRTAQQFAADVLTRAITADSVVGTLEDFSSRNLNRKFVRDMAFASLQARQQESVLVLVSENVYPSCSHERFYSSNERRRTRILTPQESAQFTIEQLKRIESESNSQT